MVLLSQFGIPRLRFVPLSRLVTKPGYQNTAFHRPTTLAVLEVNTACPSRRIGDLHSQGAHPSLELVRFDNLIGQPLRQFARCAVRADHVH